MNFGEVIKDFQNGGATQISVGKYIFIFQGGGEGLKKFQVRDDFYIPSGKKS